MLFSKIIAPVHSYSTALSSVEEKKIKKANNKFFKIFKYFITSAKINNSTT